MPKSASFASEVANLVFKTTAISGIADAAASPVGSFTLALHTADPLAGGNQATSQATYGGFTRPTVVRSAVAGTGWVMTGASASPAAPVTFGACTSGSMNVTHFSIGTGVADRMLYYGTVSPNIAVSVGVTPILTQLSTIVES